jgi:XRE family aerobic/anaerobic benzoate catabolism transcriptional regulator
LSERYLAQLESGGGNISIVLLRRVAAALGTSLEQLLDEEAASSEVAALRQVLAPLPAATRAELLRRWSDEAAGAADQRRRRIALIGLRGAGKTTLGAQLAKAHKLPFVELDRRIETEAGVPLAELFSLYGQAGFRRFERRALDGVLAEFDRCVLAAGGGIVQAAESFDLLLGRCFTVWLKARPEDHMARVVAQGDFRPMAGHAEAMLELRGILAARELAYARADVSLDTSAASPKQLLVELRRLTAQR